MGREEFEGRNTKKSKNINSMSPYNFIPLNDKIVEAEKIKDFDTYHADRYTGYIELKIKALTPLYIRDTLTIEEYNREAFINKDFFSPGGLLRIPGSSLRGMLRAMVEVIGFGKFGFFEDARLYYRAVGDTSTLGRDYRDKMLDSSNYYFPKFHAGVLRRRGSNSYEIIPSRERKGTQIYRINFDKNTGVVDGTGNLKMADFEFREIYFKAVEPQNHIHYRWDKRSKTRKPYSLRYAKLTSVSLTQDEKHPDRGYIVSSGHMNKKHMHWVINEPDPSESPIPLDEEVINSYKNDKQRKAPDLLKKLKDDNIAEVPCFYLTDQSGKIISFGHTGMFRLAYEKTIGDHVPSVLKDPNIVDIAGAIFGNEKTHASRVFFEDFYLDENKATDNFLLNTDIPQILSSPKPTCFQHYLEQTPVNLNDHPKNLAHYNSNNPIRGYKFYWHRSGTKWEAEEITFDTEKFKKFLEDNGLQRADFRGFIREESDKKVRISLKQLPFSLKEAILKAVGVFEEQHTLLTPVRSGAIFKGRIRFENLSKVELGALLFALDLPEGHAHKLGMGKPIGLGSVRISPRLFLSNRKKRYEAFEEEWYGLPEASREGKRIKDFKEAFNSYVLEKIGSNKRSLWEEERMKELKRMLDFEGKPEEFKTTYLTLEEFRNRYVLPKPRAF